jgi:hypothetical protein
MWENCNLNSACAMWFSIWDNLGWDLNQGPLELQSTSPKLSYSGVLRNTSTSYWLVATPYSLSAAYSLHCLWTIIAYSLRIHRLFNVYVLPIHCPAFPTAYWMPCIPLLKAHEEERIDWNTHRARCECLRAYRLEHSPSSMRVFWLSISGIEAAFCPSIARPPLPTLFPAYTNLSSTSPSDYMNLSSTFLSDYTNLSLNSTAYSLPIHCLFTAYSLPIHCLCTAYSLPIHCLFTAYSLPIHCLFTAYSLWDLGFETAVCDPGWTP